MKNNCCTNLYYATQKIFKKKTQLSDATKISFLASSRFRRKNFMKNNCRENLTMTSFILYPEKTAALKNILGMIIGVIFTNLYHCEIIFIFLAQLYVRKIAKTIVLNDNILFFFSQYTFLY